MTCEDVKDEDADKLKYVVDDIEDYSQRVTGTLNFPERILIFLNNETFSQPPEEYDQYFNFSLEKPFKRGFQSASPMVTVKPKAKRTIQIKRTPPRVKKEPLAEKLVTLKTLLKGGLITQKEYKAKRATILKEMSGGKVDPIVRKLKQVQKLLYMKLITPADAAYKRRQILDYM